MFSNILSGAAGFPVADLGDTIEQSLRFGGVSGQKLVGSSAIAVDDTYTLSFWYKHTHNTTRYRGSIFTNNGGNPYLSFNASNGGYSGIEVTTAAPTFYTRPTVLVVFANYVILPLGFIV